MYFQLFFPDCKLQSTNDLTTLLPYMHLKSEPDPEPESESKPQIDHTISILPKNISVEKSNNKTVYWPKQPDKLFWCMHIAIHGMSVYQSIGHKYGNIEIEEKQQIIEKMKQNPSDVKNCTKRITKALYQEIMSDFMTNKKMTVLMVAIYAILYEKPVWIVRYDLRHYMKITQCSNDGDGDGNTDDVVIIYHKNKYDYGFELSTGDEKREIIEKIQDEFFCFENFDMPLKAISTYKMGDLETIYERLQKGMDSHPKMKKQELYNKIVELCKL